MFSLFTLIDFAQLSASMFRFNGQVLDTDSVPVAHAYLVNYRTVRAYATNNEGQFNIPVQAGDSLKIIHVAYNSKIVKATPNDTIIWVTLQDNKIEEVTVKSVDHDLENFYKNWNVMMMQLHLEPQYNYSHNFVRNPYAPSQNGPSGIIEFNLFEIIDRIKHARKKKR